MIVSSLQVLGLRGLECKERRDPLTTEILANFRASCFFGEENHKLTREAQQA